MSNYQVKDNHIAAEYDVNGNVITQDEVNERVKSDIKWLKENGTALSPEQVESLAKVPVLESQLDDITNSKISKGNVSVADINKSLGKINSSYLTDDLIQAIAGTAGVHPTLQVRSLVSGEVAMNSITPELTTFFVTSKNLFNKETRIMSKQLDISNGLLLDKADMDVSDYTPIIPNVMYTRNSANVICFYDKDFTFISSIGANRQITTPTNSAYARYTVPKSIVETYQFELGGVETLYEPYKKSIDTNFIEDKSIDSSKTNFFEIGKNIFNKSLATSGYYVSSTNGVLAPNASYTASNYIEVKGNTMYSYNFSGQVAFYDANKVYISGITGIGSPSNLNLTTPSNCAYIRFSTKLPDEFQVELGSKCTSYEEYASYIKDKFIRRDDNKQNKEEVLLFLPKEICVAVGRTIEIYNSQVLWCGNINNYHFNWDCQIGKSMKRKFSVTGTTLLIGEYPLVCKIYDNNMTLINSATTTVKIVSDVLPVAKNVLIIGDSLTNTTSTPKPWLNEIQTLSNNKINFVGTRGTTVGQKHEGRSGWASSTYNSGASYTFEGEGVNPFWDGSKFSWVHYKTNTGINPDAVEIFLGTNGMNLDPTNNANNIKTLVDSVRANDSNIPIFIVYTLYRGNQDGIGNQTSNDGYANNRGLYKLEEDRKVFNLMVKLNSLLGGYTSLYFIPISTCHDSEYNFGAVETSVNPRAIQKELLPSEATHPQTQGYLQFADIHFSVYAKYLK